VNFVRSASSASRLAAVSPGGDLVDECRKSSASVNDIRGQAVDQRARLLARSAWDCLMVTLSPFFASHCLAMPR